MLHAIRATGEWHDYGVANNVAVIDFQLNSPAADFCGDKAALVEHLLTTPYNDTIAKARSSAAQLLRFAGCDTGGNAPPVSAGDIILYVGNHGKVSIGEIEGGYFFAPDGGRGYRHRRKVKWHIADIPRPEFDDEFGKGALKGYQAVFRPGGNDETRRLEIENRARRYIERR